MDNIKPCPFCGSENIRDATTTLAFCLRCLDCRGEMRSFISIDDAREKWNRRYPQVYCDCGDSLTQGGAVCGTCHDIEVMTERVKS